MRTASLAVAFLVCVGACATEASQPILGRTAYVNGFDFDGERFQIGAIVVEGDRIVSAAPSTAAERIDLAGGYIVPAFCEAHNHNLGAPEDNESGEGLGADGKH